MNSQLGPMDGRWHRSGGFVWLRSSLEPTVIVTVIAVQVVEVIAHEIVDMPIMRHALMSTIRTVHVSYGVAGATVMGRTLRAIGACRLDRVLVSVIAVRVMQVAVVQVVRVAVVLDRRVTAGRSMRMRVPVVLVTFLSHETAPFARRAYALASVEKEQA
jgi:hypothetical protein